MPERVLFEVVPLASSFLQMRNSFHLNRYPLSLLVKTTLLPSVCFVTIALSLRFLIWTVQPLTQNPSEGKVD